MSSTTLTKTVGLAAAALDYATFVDQHPETPAATSVVLEHGSDGDPVIYVQLEHHADAADLINLAEYANLIEDEVTVQALRIENPVAFTSVAVSADLGGSQLWVWTHPDTEQVEALWEAMGGTPHAGTRVEVSLDELNEASGAAEDEDGDQS